MSLGHRLGLLAISTSLLAVSCGSGASDDTGVTTTVFAPATSPTEVATSTVVPTTVASETHSFTAEVWADNWFSLYVNGTLVGEDSVSITTERSFNAETITFEAAYPLTVAMVSKDYVENETGLEYIGQPNQQMGDGGFIAQFTDNTTGRVVLTTSSAWAGLAIETAPLNVDCEKSVDPLADCRFEQLEEPTGWQTESFDVTNWSRAVEYTAAEVGTKDGYDTITWDSSARLIWGDNLDTQNTILWRAPIVE